MDPSIRYNFKRYLIPRCFNVTSINVKETCKAKNYKYDSVLVLQAEVKALYIRANHETSFKR